MSLDYTPPTPNDPATSNVWGTAVNNILNAIKTAVNAKLETSVYNSHKSGSGDKHKDENIMSQLSDTLGYNGYLDELIQAIVGSQTELPISLKTVKDTLANIDSKQFDLYARSNGSGVIIIEESTIKTAFGIGGSTQYGINPFMNVQCYILNSGNIAEPSGASYQIYTQATNAINHVDELRVNGLTASTDYRVVLVCRKLYHGVSGS